MLLHTITTHSALPIAVDTGVPPEWLQLTPLGMVTGSDGRGPYVIGDTKRAQSIIDASMERRLIPIDENHATEHAKKTGIASPARGWVVDMQVRDDGIWGRVEWTPTGATLMTEKAYKGISPTWSVDVATGQVLKILNAALTNTPNITEIHTHSQQDEHMNLVALRAKLGVAADADEAAILAAIDKRDTAIAAHSQEIASIAAAAKVTATDAPGIVTAIQSQLAGGMVPMASVIALQTQVDMMKADAAKAKAVAFVDGAIKDGKPIAAAAVRDALMVQHSQDPVATEKMINAMPNINAGGVVIVPQAEGAGDADALTSIELQTAQKMGIDPVKMLETKKKTKGAG